MVASKRGRRLVRDAPICQQVDSGSTSIFCAGGSNRPFKISKVEGGTGKRAMFVAWIVWIACCWCSFSPFGGSSIWRLRAFIKGNEAAMIGQIAAIKASYASEDSLSSILSEERKMLEILFPVCSSEEERGNGCFLCDFDSYTKDEGILVNMVFARAKKVSGRENRQRLARR
jgi:hypothetical protein